jgi:hypothetical protein
MARIASRLASLTRSALGAVLFGLVLCGPAWAVLVTVDEHGHGTIDGTPLSFRIGTDTGPGGQIGVLIYTLPFPVFPGDVLLIEGESGLLSDVLRFNSSNTSTDLVFYSDNTDGSDSLADTTAGPSAFYANPIAIAEIGSEGDNGAFYTPTSTQPGFNPSMALTYHFISDGVLAVAEPSPLALLLLGLGMMAFGLKRRGPGIG